VRILYTITNYPPAVGGAQLHTHQIVKRIATREAVQVVAHWAEHRTDWLLGTTLRAPRDSRSYTIDQVPVQTITLSPQERVALAPFVATYYLIKSTAINRISNLLASKIERYAGEPDLVHNARVGREGLSYASLKVARKRDVPFVFVPYHHPRWVGWNYRQFIALYRQADAVIALTEVEKQTLIRLGVREERIFITGMGPVLAPSADGERARDRYCLGDAPVILFLGQQYRYKGVRELVEAAPRVWSRFPEARFIFVGPGTRFSRQLFAGVSDPRVAELGNVSLEDKTDLLAACTLLCVPSTQESFGGVYTEAWMMGKPVIGGDIPAIREVISEGENGFLVPQQPDEIAVRINCLLEQPALREQMGASGKARVLERFTWDRLAEQTREVYTAVLS
jgi:glycosyltransferase involved in cell wall biosynthesis